ncbi:MAG: Smr/MutS family protein [Bacilli bacterium]
MRTLNDIIFVDSLPKLDLHGYDRFTASIAITDFIKDKIKEKIEIFVIVHGNGSGVLRKTTIENLKKNRNVLEYKQYYYNMGCTLVRIKV